MGLSTNSVFHFTQSLDVIKNILASNFRIKYCIECIESKSELIDYAVPMVSFCDIPLSQVVSHIYKYGGYGIGLSKTWAKRKGLNPVLYLESHSTILNDVLIPAKLDGSGNQVIQEFLRYTKNFEGQLVRGGEIVQKSYRFHDEREWRYCPTQKELKDNPLIIFDIHHYRENKQSINERLWDLGLSFTFKDISYLIVKDDKEILDIIEFLGSYPLPKKRQDGRSIMISKIVTAKQIRTDF